MKNIVTLVLCLLSAILNFSYAQSAQMDLPRAKITAGMNLIDVQLATTPEQRAAGLMFRGSMPVSEGMLFVFDESAQQCFWMKNTSMPLTAAFVAEDGVIVNLIDMKPQSTVPHCSAQPVRFVLEMNQGWFDRRGIKAGFKLKGRPFVSR